MEEFIENKASVYEESIRVKSVYSKEDEMRDPENKKEGLEYTFIPLVSNEAEAFERLKFLTGQQYQNGIRSTFLELIPKSQLKSFKRKLMTLKRLLAKQKNIR